MKPTPEQLLYDAIMNVLSAPLGDPRPMQALCNAAAKHWPKLKREDYGQDVLFHAYRNRPKMAVTYHPPTATTLAQVTAVRQFADPVVAIAFAIEQTTCDSLVTSGPPPEGVRWPPDAASHTADPMVYHPGAYLTELAEGFRGDDPPVQFPKTTDPVAPPPTSASNTRTP